MAGVVYDGRDVFTDMDYTQDTLTVALSFQGFESPACGIRAYEWALGGQLLRQVLVVTRCASARLQANTYGVSYTLQAHSRATLTSCRSRRTVSSC